jgi:hypothetical protein
MLIKIKDVQDDEHKLNMDKVTPEDLLELREFARLWAPPVADDVCVNFIETD